MGDYRIEAATKEEWSNRAFNAEAKLAKAMEALREFKDFDDMPTSHKRPDVFELRVRRKLLTTLAELEEKE